MFYLHPAIKSITFSKKESVISNINVSDVVINNGKDKESKPFIKSVNPVSICMYLPDNSDFGKLNINGKLTVNLLNKHNKSTYLSFTEINKSFPYSLHIHDKINLIINKNNFYKQKNLRNINISDGSNNQNQSSNSNQNSIQPFVPPINIKDQIVSELKKYVDVKINKLKDQVNNLTNKLNNIDSKFDENGNITTISNDAIAWLITNNIEVKISEAICSLIITNKNRIIEAIGTAMEQASQTDGAAKNNIASALGYIITINNANKISEAIYSLIINNKNRIIEAIGTAMEQASQTDGTARKNIKSALNYIINTLGLT